ncbi:MAG: hypothetical protein IJH28_00370 [Mogibacterium sp.]|nr:hypothetical protein [Mogibacterium sp.]
MDNRRKYDDDDGRTVADMSGVEPQPMLMPSASSIRKLKEGRADFEEPPKPGNAYEHYGPEQLDREGRRAMIGGAMSAVLLVGGLLFAAFAVVIFIIGHLL